MDYHLLWIAVWGGNRQVKILDEYEYRIRRLTPKEYGRLMGVSDEDYEKMASVNSNSQLYKQLEFKENNIDKEFKEHLKEKMRGALEMDFAMAFGEKTREEIMKEVMEKKRGENSLS